MNREVNGGNSIDPSLSAGNLTDRRLSRLRPEITTILGVDAVLGIESAVEQLKDVQQLRTIENPFTDPGPSQVDLSLLGSTQRSRIIENFHRLSPSERKAAEKTLNLSIDEAKILAELMGRSLRQNEWQVGRNTPTLYSTIYKIRDLAAEVAAGGELATAELGRLFEEARGKNQKLPSDSTIQTYQNIYELWDLYAARLTRQVEELKKAGKGSRRLRLAISANLAVFKNQQRASRKGRQWILAAAERKREARVEGTEIFEATMVVLDAEEIKRAGALLDELINAREIIPSAEGRPPEQLEEMAVSEKYLAERSAIFEASVRELKPAIADDPRVKAALAQVRRSLAVEAQQQAQEQKMAGFNRLISEANDVLVGGRRLKPTKAVPNPAQIAEGLEKVFKDEEEKPIIERGLIVAMLTGRFNSFVATVQRIKYDRTNGEVMAVEKQRPHIFQALRDLEIESRMVCLDALLINYADKLPSILSDDQIKSIRRTLDKYFGRQIEEEPTISPTNAGTIEQFFAPGELIGELDFAVLPYGEKGEQDLEAAAREIVEEAQARAERGIEVKIELERLNILKRLRSDWGADKSHYERGKLRDRKKVRVKGEEGFFDEYIILVLQQLDEQGQVIREHAVAESPIAGPNALYIFRADTEMSRGFSWRQVFSVSKAAARDIGGARDLHHTKGDGRPVVDVLTDRANLLLRCKPEEFYAIRFKQGGYWLRRGLGQVASNSA